MQPKNLLTIILESAFLFFLSASLIRMGVNILIEIWPALLIIAIVILIITICWRIWKHMHDMGKW